MIGHIKAEEAPGRASARRQRGWRGLDRGTSELVLQPRVRQACSKCKAKRISVAEGGAEELHPIGRKATRAVKASVRNPGVQAALREVLPAHDHLSVNGVPRDMVVDILRGVGFVVHQEATVAEADVLDENRIEGWRGGACIHCLQMPQPSGVLRMQRECEAEADTACLRFPYKAVSSKTEPGIGAWAGGLEWERSLAVNAHIHPAYAAIDR